MALLAKAKPGKCLRGLRLKLVVRPKGLEPLLQAPEACVISTSLRVHDTVNYNTGPAGVANGGPGRANGQRRL
jgi:hypothetical protein